MKNIILILILLCFSMPTSADDEPYYTIYDNYDKKPDNNLTETQTYYYYEEGDNKSQSIVKDDIYKMTNEMRTSRNRIYQEIRRFKYNF